MGSRVGLKEVSEEVRSYKLGTKKISNIKPLPTTWETGRRPRKMRHNDKLTSVEWEGFEAL